MSSYPDDRYDDRRDDHFDDGRRDGRAFEEARAAVRVPAVLLIITGALLFVAAVLGFIQLPSQPAKMDAAIADVDANKNMPADQKDMMKKIFTTMKEFFEGPVAPVSYSLSIVFAILIAVGGVKLMNLSGSGLALTSSILAMIPCTSSCCCLLGLPAGIWAIAVMSRPHVKAAFAANRAGRITNPDDQYMR
jgi:TRAP-type C4-dicarboxylate transport system permease small subunit